MNLYTPYSELISRLEKECPEELNNVLVSHDVTPLGRDNPKPFIAIGEKLYAVEVIHELMALRSEHLQKRKIPTTAENIAKITAGVNQRLREYKRLADNFEFFDSMARKNGMIFIETALLNEREHPGTTAYMVGHDLPELNLAAYQLMVRGFNTKVDLNSYRRYNENSPPSTGSFFVLSAVMSGDPEPGMERGLIDTDLPNIDPETQRDLYEATSVAYIIATIYPFYNFNFDELVAELLRNNEEVRAEDAAAVARYEERVRRDREAAARRAEAAGPAAEVDLKERADEA